ncbi:MAG TPA: orotidine-5'-phosphate decarboxylase [Pseudonocardia sp.]|uniref:orotidine-5'-phosphate decarboxylase n=1 Tax=Pseudonocardia sp. TaxID=60912 RepID=UPI002D1D8652|nr:orotidine-5'-phosphate decarboxylase [Pseudonocardia sp.]HTF49952.1 orotidine-5'-phosphate decarboxylase [Pseudonocardia sp.]
MTLPGPRDGVPFGRRLADAVAEHGPLCVGIDPHRGLLAAWGLADDQAGLERFARGAMAALAGQVALVKPQSAFFERHGSAGVAVLERVLADARDAGTLVLLDVKRGDIGSTMGGYADAYLTDGSPLAADAVTLSPYLGFGSLAPALTAAAGSGRGVFVLARTSNPDGAQVQTAQVQLADRDGRSVAQAMVDAAAAENAGRAPMGHVGVVVGATHEHGLELSGLNGPVLAPGLGAQGGTPADLAVRFAAVTGVVLPSVSRAVLENGPDQAALRVAVRTWQAELAGATEQAGATQ